jgi:porin
VQLLDVSATWGGALVSRLRLPGNWGGLREELSKKGAVFDVNLNVTREYLVHGGGVSTGGDTSGSVDCALNLDTGKLGLWPGGFFMVRADAGFGTNVFSDPDTVVPVNSGRVGRIEGAQCVLP